MGGMEKKLWVHERRKKKRPRRKTHASYGAILENKIGEKIAKDIFIKKKN